MIHDYLHPFEEAGLGQAPFYYVTTADEPGTRCDKCDAVVVKEREFYLSADGYIANVCPSCANDIPDANCRALAAR